jgi:cell division protease FtsH
VILVGPPGSGKTLLAKAIAGEANVPFFSMSGSDFVEMFVGVGASRVRDLFRQAKENSPAIIFLDEIDAVGRQRGAGLGGGHDEREQTLNAILVEMDGFDTDTGVIIIAATNRPDVLDSALLRPGRFDRQIAISLPDMKGREAILKVHVRKVKLHKSVDLKKLAKITPMFSGADLEAIINEAALLAVMKKKESVDMEDLEESRDKVRWGRQKRSRVMDEEDKKVTAYHESGHALAAYFIPEAEKVHKVTIVPRGSYLGATMQMPEKDRYHMHKKYLLGTITVFFAGRVAEETFCDDISSGAQSDIKQATHLARMMVCEWGMSEKLGPISYTDSEEHLFLGREISRTKPHSEATSLAIDQEIKDILMKCYERAKKIINDHKDTCQRMARALMKHEILNTSDVANIIKGVDIDPIKEKENNDQKKKTVTKSNKTKPEKSSTPTPPDKESGTTVSK